jgi:hypothetical protein
MYMELYPHGNNASVESYNTSITPTEYFINTPHGDSINKTRITSAATSRVCGSALLTGVSSQLSPISVRINIPRDHQELQRQSYHCYDVLLA